MDVRLPDGRVVTNVPDGMTQEDLMDRLNAGGHQTSMVDVAKGIGTSIAKSHMGAVEGMAQFGSGMVAQPVAGLAGLGNLGLSALGVNMPPAADTVRMVQNAMTYQPRTAQGQVASQIAGLPGEAIQYAGNQIRRLPGPLADQLATTAEFAAQAIPTGIAGAGMLKAAAERPPPMPPTQQQAILKPAQDLGMVVAPSEMGQSSWYQGAGGKIRTAQLASTTNTEVATRVAHEQLGIPQSTPLTPKTLADYRASQYSAGELPLKQYGKPFMSDETYIRDVLNLSQDADKLRVAYPQLTVAGADKISKLADGLMVQKHPADAAVTLIRKLREDASANLGGPQPSVDALALGHAQKAAANAIEGLIERNLRTSGDMALLDKFRQARQNIATAHTVEDASNKALGTVNPRKLGDSTDPISGDLLKVANFGSAFRRSTQQPEVFGGVPPISPLDVSMGTATGIGGAIATGNPVGLAAGALPFMRPMISQIPLSSGYQRGLLAQPQPLPQFGVYPYISPLFSTSGFNPDGSRRQP